MEERRFRPTLNCWVSSPDNVMKNKIIVGFVVLAFVFMFVTACSNLESSSSSETSETEETSSDLITGETTRDVDVEDDEDVVDDEEETTEEVEEEPEENLVEVSITESGFEPRELNLKVGDTVKWTNNRAEMTAMLIGVQGLEAMKSKFLESGETFTWKFDETGFFGYVDAVYTSQAGTIAVNK